MDKTQPFIHGDAGDGAPREGAWETDDADCAPMPASQRVLLAKPANVRVPRSAEPAGMPSSTSKALESTETDAFEGVSGRSSEMRRIFHVVSQVAPTRATVLLTGESGTGKGLIAEAIHRRSPRSSGPFVKLHCAALSQTLLESELFGHERGAFTGAERRRQGRFEAASGGTLFLDEVGELPLCVQTKLLRVLQEHEFERVGGNQTIQTDVRVIAATNRNLEAMVSAGELREDLFYRLNVVAIAMPPLRRRRMDIPVLALRLLEKHRKEGGSSACTLGREALRLLTSHDWPGNVRELENAIQHALVFSSGRTIEPEHFPCSVTSASSEDRARFAGATLAEIERRAILTTLEAVGGCKAEAARVLGVSVRMIYYRLRQYAAEGRADEYLARDTVPAEGTAEKE